MNPFSLLQKKTGETQAHLEQEASLLLKNCFGLFFALLGIILFSRCLAFWTAQNTISASSSPFGRESIILLSHLNLFFCTMLAAASIACLIFCLQVENRIALCHTFLEDYFSLLFSYSALQNERKTISFLLSGLRKHYRTLTNLPGFRLAYHLTWFLWFFSSAFWLACFITYLISALQPLRFTILLLTLFFAGAALLAFRFQYNLFRFCQTKGKTPLEQIPAWQNLDNLSFLLKSNSSEEHFSDIAIKQVFLNTNSTFSLKPHSVDYQGNLKNFWYLFLIHFGEHPDNLIYASLRPVGINPKPMHVKELFIVENFFPLLPSLKPQNPASLLEYFNDNKEKGQKIVEATAVFFLPPCAGKTKWAIFSLQPIQIPNNKKGEEASLLFSLLENKLPIGHEKDVFDLLSSQCFSPDASFAVTQIAGMDGKFFTPAEFANKVLAVNGQIRALLPRHSFLFSPWDE